MSYNSFKIKLSELSIQNEKFSNEKMEQKLGITAHLIM